MRSARTVGRVTKTVKGYVREDYKVDRPHPEGRVGSGVSWEEDMETSGGTWVRFLHLNITEILSNFYFRLN